MITLALFSSVSRSWGENWDLCTLVPICGTIEQTKLLRRELKGGGRRLEEALTKRRQLVSRHLRRSQRLCRDLLLRIESP
jgi:hypothetical protein